MNVFTENWLAIANVGRDHSAGWFVLAFAAMAMLQTAEGMGRTRQWYLLPVVFGLTALVGFLLNPFADANTPADLRIALTSFETLTLLCVGQFLLLTASLCIGVLLDRQGVERRGEVCLAVVHAIPAPAVAIAMLLIEQGRLTSVPGARPEAVGREVGLVVAGTLTLACAVAMTLPDRVLALPHQMLSVAMLVACMFVPCLEAPLPQPVFHFDADSARLSWQFGAAAAVMVLAGWWGLPTWGLGPLRRRVQKLSTKTMSLNQSLRGDPWDC